MLKLTQEHELLMYGAIKKELVTTDSTLNTNKIKESLTPTALKTITSEFKENPEKIIKVMIENLRAISTNNSYSEKEQEKKLDLYYGAWVDLLIRFDDKLFPRTNPLRVYSGIPDYIPEGLVDMGFNPSLNERNSREKIYIEKERLLRGSKKLFFYALENGLDEKQTIRLIADAVYQKMPLDRVNRGNNFGDKTIKLLEDIIQSPEPKAVCRHQSLTAQVLIQSMGIVSRLLKCNVYSDTTLLGAHSANLVNFQNNWYLLDITIPLKINGELKFAFAIKYEKIDTHKNNYEWKNPTTNMIYKSRNDMFYRIK